jgi:hypothetical protein
LLLAKATKLANRNTRRDIRQCREHHAFISRQTIRMRVREGLALAEAVVAVGTDYAFGGRILVLFPFL